MFDKKKGVSAVELAKVIAIAAKEHEKSWCRSTQSYKISVDLALDKAMVDAKTPVEWYFPLKLLMQEHWNDVMAWAETMLARS